jgi:phospholipase/lecithinase/hemolysin
MNDRKQLQQVFALALVMVLLAGCGGAPAEPIATPIPISHVYAFGDSFSDNGNLKQLAPSDPWWDTHWEGRTSNGLVAVEVLADRLSVELTDYAVTGAKSDTSNVNPRFPSTGALGQLEKFKTELDGHSADPNALYFVMIGVNDFFEVLTDFPIDNPTLTDQTVDNIATLITQLAQLGAKRFLVINSADTAVMPYVIANGRSDDAAEFQTLINSKLSSRLDELKSQLEIEITSFDYVTLSTRIRENPSDYGLSNLTDACQPVFLGVKPACASPDQYYFWDEVHPTRRVHQIFGEAWAALYGK